MKKILPSLSLSILFLSNTAFAFTTEMKCTNNERIMVPLGASNSFIPNYFFYLMIGISLFMLFIFALKAVYKKIKKQQLDSKNIYGLKVFSILSIIFILAFGASNYYETLKMEDFAGVYKNGDKTIEFVMKGGHLINSNSNSRVEYLGAYFLDKSERLLILREDSDYYSIDFKNQRCEKLVRVNKS